MDSDIPPLESFDLPANQEDNKVGEKVQELKDHMTMIYRIVHRIYIDPNFRRLALSNPDKAKQKLETEFKTFAFQYPARFRTLQKERPDTKVLLEFYKAQMKNIHTPDVGKYGNNKTEFAQSLARRYMPQFLKEGEAPL